MQRAEVILASNVNSYKVLNADVVVITEKSLDAENLGVKNLVLYHTEDKNIKKRKELYGAEGREYYHGNLFIPDDLDVIEM